MITQALDAISWTESIGFALIAVATGAAWVRDRTVARAWLAVAVGLLAAIILVSRVQQVTGVRSTLLGHVVLVAFLASGYVLTLFRNSVLPLPRLILGGLFGLLVAVSVATFVVTLPSGLAPSPTVTQWIFVWALVLLWCGCVAEPALRFWIASRGRPVVQRTRLRALSAGYGAVVVLLLLSLGVRIVVGPLVMVDPGYRLMTALVGLGTVPLLYMGFAPSRWLRRMWRSREEGALRHATGDLLLAADHVSLAERSLDWALRLVGADRGLLAGAGGEVLAHRGVDASETAELLALDLGSAGLRRVSPSLGGTALVTPLSISGARGMIALLPGPFTPVFGDDEVTRLGEYGLSVAVATERVRVERLRGMQFAVTRTLAEARTLAGAAPHILESMATALDWRTAILYLVDADQQRLRMHAGWVSPGVGDRVLQATSAVTWGIGEGLPGLVWRTSRPVSIREVTTDPRVRGWQVAPEEGFRGAAGLPIVHEGSVTGVITFGCFESRELGDDLLSVLADIGSQIGQFVERKRVEAALAASAAQLAALASTDPLTGLPNRREFERVVEAPQPRRFAVLAIDVDNLKTLNDTYGHEAGDAALRAVATALRMGSREGDVVARTGGDEFAVLLPGASATEAAAAAERLRGTMHGVALPRGQARISIGYAVGPAGHAATRCWAMADDALYRAKARGRDRSEFVSDREGIVADGQRRWESLLPMLMVEGAIGSVFQPIVDLRTREAIGYEALARPSTLSAEISVDSLFGAAGRLGVGRDLDWVSRRAALHGARTLPPGRPVFINVGADSLLDPVHDVDQMLLLLRWAGRRPDQVVLEITERDAIRDLDRLVEVLVRYRASGFRFALDDVGEGHSTLEVLAAATPEFLKVAGSLVRRLDKLGPRSAIEALVTFALATGAEVIAEGIESAGTIDMLCDLGVTLGQGFALGRPASPVSLQSTSNDVATSLRRVAETAPVERLRPAG